MKKLTISSLLVLASASPAAAAPREISIADGSGALVTLRLAEHEKFVKDAAGGAKIMATSEVAGAQRKSASLRAIEDIYYVAGWEGKPEGRRVLSSSVMVEVGDATDRATICAALEAMGLTTRCPEYSDSLVYATFANGTAALASLDSVRALSGVNSAELVWGQPVNAAWVPNDPFLNKSEKGGQGQWYISPEDPRNLGAVSAWNTVRGKGVRVNVVDTGVQLGHPDLAAGMNKDLDKDYRDDDQDPIPGSELGENHGTAVAGIIGARSNNGRGIAGIAPECEMIAVRIHFTNMNDIEYADVLSHKSKLIDISNNSWGSNTQGYFLRDFGPAVREAFTFGTKEGRAGKGVVYVISAGNSGEIGDHANRSGLLNNPYSLVVGAMDATGGPAGFTTPGPCVGISAYGDSVTTTTITSADKKSYIDDFNGTSAAAPMVSGVAALVLDTRPTLSWRDVHTVLMRSAVRTDTTKPGTTPAPGSPSTIKNKAGYQFDDNLGAGRVDAARAVRLAKRWQTLSGLVTHEYRLGGMPLAIPDFGNEDKPTSLKKSISVPSGDNLRMESVLLTFNIKHLSRGELEIHLTSPSGTTSKMLAASPIDNNAHIAWTCRSVQYWGEHSAGTWKVKVIDNKADTTGTVEEMKIKIFGAKPIPAPVVRGGYDIEVYAGEEFVHDITATNNPGEYAIEGLPVELAMDDLGRISGTPKESAIHRLKVTAKNPAGSHTSEEIVLVVYPPREPEPAPLKTWKQEYFNEQPLAQQSNTADADGDGLVNIMEYALGSDPMLASPGAAQLQSLSGGITYTWQESLNAPSVKLICETSANLKDWIPLTPAQSEPDTFITRHSAPIPTGSASQFVRLRVEMAP